MTTTDKLPPVHPGEILMEDFLKEMGITQHKLAVSIGVPPRRINEIVHGKRAVTADTSSEVFRDEPSVLARVADPVRPGCGRRQNPLGNRADSPYQAVSA